MPRRSRRPEGIASGFVRARHISCGECELADLLYVPGTYESLV